MFEKFSYYKVFWGDSLVSQAPGSHFKMLVTQPRSKKNQNGPRTSLMGPGGAVWEKTDFKKSPETVPLCNPNSYHAYYTVTYVHRIVFVH